MPWVRIATITLNTLPDKRHILKLYGWQLMGDVYVLSKSFG